MMRTLVGLLLLSASTFGCAGRPALHEVGTPAQRYPGNALVVLPRSCVAERSVPAKHFMTMPLADRATESQPAVKTARLQALLDGLVPNGKPASGASRPETECESPPEVGPEDWFLADLRATEATLQAMRASGASYVVVLEVHTVMACARHDDTTALAHHGTLGAQPGIGAPAPSRWRPDDVCLEDEVKLAAWMFDATGVAVWGLTRDVLPTDEPGFVLDRVLDRVPVAIPLQRHQGEFEIATSPSRSPSL